MVNKVLFIGNGINDIKNDYQWKDLIDNLIDYVDGEGRIINDKSKPFPLLYEEIYARAIAIGKEEDDLKSFIAADVNKLPKTDIHSAIMRMNFEDIITSNYDFTLEKVLYEDFEKLENNGHVKENLYSIFRYYNVSGKNVWHVHGDSNHPKTINLGYEHYSGYLQQMRNYVVTPGTDYKKFKKDPLIRRLKNGEKIGFESWIDHFFINDIYFIGLTLDFIEIDLWWLLTIRKRSKPKKGVEVKNHIVYFYPDILHDKIIHKRQLLESLDVIPVQCKYDPNDKMPYYHEVLRKIDLNIEDLKSD